MTADLLEGRVAELEQRARRFRLATTGIEGWENYFQSLARAASPDQEASVGRRGERSSAGFSTASTSSRSRS